MSDIKNDIQKYINISIKNDLLAKYEYEGSEILLYLFTYFLFKKYALSIPPKCIFSYHIKAEKITNGSSKIFKDISEYFLNSNKQKSFLLLQLSHLTEKGRDIGFFDHLNLIIYDKKNFTIEHYEPVGKFNNIYWNEYGKCIFDLLYKKLKKYIPNLKFKTSINLHGFSTSDTEMLGLQSIEHRQNHKGHCQIWCYLLAELITKYPEIPTESIIRDYLDLNNFEGLSKKNFYRKLKMIVRGFYHYSMSKISKFKELSVFDFNTINILDYQILTENIKIVKNVISIIFYDNEYEEINYLLQSSILKSYIIIFGFENTKKIFKLQENKNELKAINKIMNLRPNEEFLESDYELLKDLYEKK